MPGQYLVVSPKGQYNSFTLSLDRKSAGGWCQKKSLSPRPRNSNPCSSEFRLIHITESRGEQSCVRISSCEIEEVRNKNLILSLKCPRSHGITSKMYCLIPPLAPPLRRGVRSTATFRSTSLISKHIAFNYSLPYRPKLIKYNLIIYFRF